MERGSGGTKGENRMSIREELKFYAWDMRDIFDDDTTRSDDDDDEREEREGEELSFGVCIHLYTIFFFFCDSSSCLLLKRAFDNGNLEKQFSVCKNPADRQPGIFYIRSHYFLLNFVARCLSLRIREWKIVKNF